MSSYTPEQVLALAPDSSSASAGQALASLKKWNGIGKSDRAIWGLCQGSGKDPYQARVDLGEPAFKCSCPSRKFPCKHGLGLMLLFARDGGSFRFQDEPGWVSDWLAGRTERAEKKVEKAREAAAKPVDLEAQAKRAAQREARASDGVAGCRVWLEDVIRRGLAAAQSESAATWDRTAARLVDAQTPGLATLVRRIPELLASGPGWAGRTLDHLGRLHLLLRGADQLPGLPDDLALDVRTALGWNQSKDEVLARSGIADRWAILGQIQEEEERLRVRRTWLLGTKSKQRALIFDFAAGLAPMDQSLVVGTQFDGELVFYPGRLALRALVKSRGDAGRFADVVQGVGDLTIETGLRTYAEALAANPWTSRWPMLISDVRIAQDGNTWHLVDSADAGLAIKPSFAAGLQLWRLIAAGGGTKIPVVVEWDGEFATPLGAIIANAYYDFAPRWAA